MRRALALIGVCALAYVGAAATWPGDLHEMTRAAEAFLAALSDEERERATFALDSEEREHFHFIPPEMFARGGVSLEDLAPAARERAHALLRAGLSGEGYLTATQVMELEDVLRALESGERFARDRDAYFLSVFGTPGEDPSWAWRFEGHHLSLHLTIVGGEVAVLAPGFVGASPAEVREGPQTGRRPLASREDAGRSLVRMLDEAQRGVAIIDVEAPRDILTGAASEVEPLDAAGLLVSEMTAPQRGALLELIDVYLGMASDEIARERRERLIASGVDAVRFAWAGGVEPGQPHYYRVQGPTFLIEYDNTQNGANHIHSVWRDFEGDFGRDLLREHHARHPHE